MQILRILLTLAFLTSLSQAEVRLMNGTEQPLTVDIGPQKGVVVPVGHTISDVVGSKLGANESEVMVVHTADGTELLRDEVQTDHIYAINTFGDRLIYNKVGRFQGKPSNKSFPILINATGQELVFKVEYPDGKVYTKKSRAPRTPSAITSEKVGQSRKLGDTMSVTIEVPGGSAGTTMEVGKLYLLTNDGKTSITPVD
jgi:hypothetical protein